MSREFSQETAETCLRLLAKHEPQGTALERSLRVNISVLRREGFKIGRITPANPEKRLSPGRPVRNTNSASRKAAIMWLDQPRPRQFSQKELALRFGISQPAVCESVAVERRARRLRGEFLHRNAPQIAA